MKPRTQIPRIGKKKLAKLDGKVPFSSIRKKPRKKSERERIYGPKGYVEWIHDQPCVACGWPQSECAHIRTGGTGRKDDWTRTIPLCGPHIDRRYTKITVGCHKLYDLKMNVIPFNTTPEKLAEATQAAWMAFSGIPERGVKK